MIKKTRVLMENNALAHYRFRLFTLLFEHKEWDLTLVLAKKKSDYPAEEQNLSLFNHIVIGPDKTFCGRMRYLSYLLTHRFDCFIGSVPDRERSLLGFLVAKLKRKKIVLWTLDWHKRAEGRGLPRKVLNWYRERKYRFLVRHSDALVVSGKNGYNFHKELGCDPKRLFPIINSVDGSKSLDLTCENPFPRGKRVLLFVSRLVEYKGCVGLVEAFKKANDVLKDDNLLLCIVGDGPERVKMERFAKDNHLENVVFYGAVNNEVVFPYYRHCDVFVLPNSGKHQVEAWGLVVNEACAAGKPVITTDFCGAYGDMVEDGKNGIVVKAGDTDELSSAIVTLFSMQPDELNQMGYESLEKFKRFNGYQGMADGFFKAVEYAVANKK